LFKLVRASCSGTLNVDLFDIVKDPTKVSEV